jgi:DNA-binding transcriptional regulator YbjK
MEQGMESLNNKMDVVIANQLNIQQQLQQLMQQQQQQQQQQRQQQQQQGRYPHRDIPFPTIVVHGKARPAKVKNAHFEEVLRQLLGKTLSYIS